MIILKFMLRSLIITYLLELIGAYFLKITNKKNIINIILVNILTNPFVVSLSFYINIVYGLKSRIICLFLLEILVILIEGIIYHKYLTNIKINPYIISLILNLLSYLIGEILNYINLF